MSVDLNVLGMTKKELRKYKKRKAQYEALCEKYSIDTEWETIKQVDRFIEEANNIQRNIDKAKKQIDEDYFEQISAIIKINKSLWTQLVNLNNRRGTIKESAIDKLKEKYDDELLYLHTKYQFLESNDFDNTAATTNLIKIPNEEDITYSDSHTCNEEADKILNAATTLKYAITQVYQKEYNRIKDAVDFITQGEFDPKMFKTVIDFNVYKSGYLKEDAIGKMEAFTDKIRDVYSTYTKYNLTMFDTYLKNRGLKIEEIE